MVLGYGNLDSLALKHSENILSLTFGRKCEMIVGVSDIFSDVHCTLYRVFFFNWCPPKNSECQPVSKFWYLEFLWWDLLCNLTLRTFRGAPVKKNTLYQYQRESITFPGRGLGWFKTFKRNSEEVFKGFSNLCKGKWWGSQIQWRTTNCSFIFLCWKKCLTINIFTFPTPLYIART